MTNLLQDTHIYGIITAFAKKRNIKIKILKNKKQILLAIFVHIC